MALDALKGFVPALVATMLVGHGAGVLAGRRGDARPLAAALPALPHAAGRWSRRCGGAFLGVAPLVGGIGAAVWLVVFALSRYASVASIAAALSLPVGPVAARLPVAGGRVRGRSPALAVRRSCTARTSRRLRRGEEKRFRFSGAAASQALSHSVSSVCRAAGLAARELAAQLAGVP